MKTIETLVFCFSIFFGNLPVTNAVSVYDLVDAVPMNKVSSDPDKAGINLFIKKDANTDELFRFLKAGSTPVSCDSQPQICSFSITSAGEVKAILLDGFGISQIGSRKHGKAEISVKTTSNSEDLRHIIFDLDAAQVVYEMLKTDSANVVDGRQIRGKNIICGFPNKRGAERLTCDLDVTKDGVPKDARP